MILSSQPVCHMVKNDASEHTASDSELHPPTKAYNLKHELPQFCTWLRLGPGDIMLLDLGCCLT